MSVSEEQEEEFEALQAIYPEIERYEESPEHPLVMTHNLQLVKIY